MSQMENDIINDMLMSKPKLKRDINPFVHAN